MKIELKGQPTLSGVAITIVSIDFEDGLVEYTVDGVGMRDINRGIHETFLWKLKFEGEGWSCKVFHERGSEK